MRDDRVGQRAHLEVEEGESTRSRMSRIWASVFCSSSVGLGEMLELVENCE